MTASQHDKPTPGTVYLVGAGPGDPGLLTRAGAEILARADVVVYDRLASPTLLNLIRADAERVYVGKASSQHTRTQDEINEILAQYALQGKSVCRLKGGDPFVFGRGGEEAAYVKQFGVPFVVVPGVTSAISVPAYAGIPVTDRRCASSFAVITGHEDADKTESTLDWAGIAHGADTLVFLMGLSNLPTIAEQLITHGRPATMPAAAIQQGTTRRQRVVTGTLADIAERVKEAGLRSPVITVVGEVVALRETLCWFENRPLFGKRILVTRAREQASDLSRMLEEAGAEAVEFPVIRVEPLPPANDFLAKVAAADWLIFTSANGITGALTQLETLGKDVRALGTAKIAAIGPATAESLQRYGLHVDYVPERFIAEAVAEGFPDPAGKKIVLLRAQEAREVLPELLTERDASVEVLPVYRTVMEEGEGPDLGEVDAITFTSASTVRNFRARYGGEINGPAIACIGPITAQTAREMGLRVDVEAEAYTIPGLVEALIRYFAVRETTE
ncbi:MAG: uroporphyrinogen-III C-methyltransferase [Armatimonadota bacterium]